MSRSFFDKPPHFDWRIDRWKVGLIVLLFLALLLGTLVDPQRDRGRAGLQLDRLCRMTAAHCGGR